MLTVTVPRTGPCPLVSLVTGSETLGSIPDFSQLAPSSVVTYTSTVPSPEGPNRPTSKPSLTWRLLTICKAGSRPRVGIWVAAGGYGVEGFETGGDGPALDGG